MNAAAQRHDGPPDPHTGPPDANMAGPGLDAAPRAGEGRRAWAATAAVALVGLTLTVIGFVLARQWEQERWRARFELIAQRRIADVQREVETQFEVVHSLRSLFDASELVEEHEFETFASQALARHPGLAALAYAPRIPARRRAFAESELGEPITQTVPGLTGALEPATDRPEYFPVLYAHGRDGFNLPRAFDAGGDPAHADALRRAIASGDLALTEPLPSISDRGSRDEAAVLAYLPVTQVQTGRLTPEPGVVPSAADVEGVIVGVVAVDQLIERAVRAPIPSAVDLHIYDEAFPERALYVHAEHGEAGPPLITDRDGVLFSGRLPVGGRTWLVICAPAYPFDRGPAPWALLVTGLLITSLLCTNVLTSMSRRQARALVEQRTRDLRNQIAEHKRAQDALQESQIRFQQIADNIDSVFWLSADAGKRLDYVSRAYERIWGRPVAELIANAPAFIDTIHPEDRERMRTLILTQDRVPQVNEYRIIRPDGAVRWIRDRSFPVRAPDGGPSRTAGLAEDITDQRLADEALRRSEERLRQVFEAVVDPIWDWNIAADRTTFSPGWATLLGYDPRYPAPDDRWEDLIHPDDRRRVQAARHAAIEGATERYEAEYRLRTRGGQYKWVLSRGRVVERDPDGRARRMIGSITDITDRRRVEDALRESEARQRAILEAVPDCMFRMRRDGTYVDYHAPDGAILLCPPEEFLGRRCVDVLPPHLAEPCERAIQAALDTGRVQTYSYSAGSDDSPRFWEVRVAPCGQDEVLAIVRDISEQRRAQDALRESEARYRLIVETAHEGVWTTDAAGRTTFVNARMAEMLGYAPDEMLGRPIREFMDDASRADGALADLHAERRRRGVQEEHDLLLRRRDGTPVWTLVSTAPVRDERGGVAGAIAMVTDITARKMAEEELRRQEARYRAVVEGQAELVCRYTPEGEVTFANDAFCRFFGRRREQIVGGPLSSAADPADAEHFAAALCAPGAEPTGPRAQTALADASGRRRWIAWSRRPIADIGGRTVEIQAVGRDVTDAKIAEEALRRSEEFNRRLIDAIPGGLVVVGADGSLLRTNRIADEFFGMPAEEVTKLRADDFAGSTFRDDGSPMPIEEYPAMQCLATGQPAGPTTIGVRRRDGEIAWGVFRAVPVSPDEGGRPDAVAVMFLDITERRRIEEAHRAGEERYRLVAEQTGQLIYDYDLDTGRIVWVGAIADVTGYTPEQFAAVDAETWSGMIHPDDRANTLEALARARADGQQFRTEYRFRRADGSYADILDNGVFIRDQSGVPRRMLGTMQDITQAKRREAALAQSESLYRLLAENATDMIARLTPAGEYLFASPASRALLGYEPDDLRGRVVFDLCESEDADLLRQAHQAVLASPDPEVFRYRARRGDGRPIWLETTARAVRDPSGQVHEIVSVSRDITARMKADRELRASEERFRSLSICSPVGIFMADPGGRLTWVNPRLQEIAGFTFDDALGDGWFASVHPDDRAWLAELWRGAAAAASPAAAEARFQHADGSVRWVRAAASPMFSDAGELIGHVGAVEDVTDRRLAERALRDSEERYRRLVESSPDGIAVHQEGRFVFVNAAGLRLFGAADPGDIIGRPVWDVIDQASRPEVQDRLRRLRDGDNATPPLDERLVRLDGTSFDAEAAASSCVYEGRPAVQVVIRDITARKSAEQRLRFQASVLSQVDDAVVAVDPAGRVTYLNAAAARAYGVAIDDVLGRPASDLFTTQWLNPQDEGRAADALRRRGRWEGLSIHVKRSGERIYVESAVSILRDEQGRDAGTLSVIRDVTERIRSEQRQALMMAELDHRVKNNLAAVLSIADHTIRSSSSLKEFSESFQGRIRALARMHHVLARGRWQGAVLGELAKHTLEPYGARVVAHGPEVTLPARAASPIAMALHELATNASKYGALSTHEGSVTVTWTIHEREPGEPPLLRLRWEESGGPPVVEPQRRGFGTELIEGGIAYELRGNVAITWRPEGLVCDMAIPLEPESDRLTPPEFPTPPAAPPPVTTRTAPAPPRRTRRDPS